MRMPLYGFDRWRKLFTLRQLTALGTFVGATRATHPAMATASYPSAWAEAVYAGLAIGVDRIADRQSTVCRWDMGYTKLQGTFTRFALPITWDYCEGNPFSDTTGNYVANLEWVAKYWEHAMVAAANAPPPVVKKQSATERHDDGLDAIVTDPPYYDAIPYSDLMDFFYIWLRRALQGEAITEKAFVEPLAPKWNHDTCDGELIDDASRHGNDATKSKQAYEDGMARVFGSCWQALNPDGRLVIVFAHKHPNAWETLVSAIIRSGFVVDGSWPIQTEMGNRTRALTGAALASSVWLVCKKRSTAARPGWDNNVMEEMRANITVKLREFWDAGIRGPDFVWAATGPALEAYSKHPVVRKANEPNATMGVGEFLTQVRRMVVDYIVGQVLSGERGADLSAADRLDEVTAYYLLHRHDFGMEDAPVGACILYATACGLSDAELEKTWDVLASSGKNAEEENAEDEDSEVEDSEPDDTEGDTSGGSKVKLKPWHQRRGKSLGYEAPQGRAVPLIDRIHRVMHLWKDGDLHKVDEYLDQHALRRHELFKRVVQSLIELSTNSERALLESISNHIGAKGAVKDRGPMLFGDEAEDE
jgi:adenine-specific DNA methylase